jgi:hypothetical protein
MKYYETVISYILTFLPLPRIRIRQDNERANFPPKNFSGGHGERITMPRNEKAILTVVTERMKLSRDSSLFALFANFILFYVTV